MKEALWTVCGADTKLKLVEPDLSLVVANLEEERGMDPDGFGTETTQDICEILALREGHDKRLDAHYDLKNIR